MNMLKITLLTVVAVLSVFQANSVKAEGMDIWKVYNKERNFSATAWESGHKEIWIGTNVGKGHRLVTVDLQGVYLDNIYDADQSKLGGRITDVRYYTDTGMSYAKFVFDNRGPRENIYGFYGKVNYKVTVYRGTSASNARSTY